jgi:hypothetical protein
MELKGGFTGDFGLVLIGTGIIAFALVGYLFVEKIPTLPDFGGMFSIVNQIPTAVGLSQPTPQRADLKSIADPYFLAKPTFQSDCIAYGGRFFYQADKVGCVGSSGFNYGACQTDSLILATANQCTATAATWACRPSEILCYYP